MAGQLIRVMGKTDLDGTDVGTTAVDLLKSDNVDMVNNTSGVLIVRVHDKSTTSASTQTCNIFVRNVTTSRDDPSANFEGSTIATATFTISGGTTGPQTPQIVALSTPISSSVRVIVAVSQSTSGSTLTFSISADLLGRE